jgi:hypothetical protein
MIARWRPKPVPRNGEDQVAAKWHVVRTDGEVDDLRQVARMADPEAGLAAVQFDTGPVVLVVRWLRTRDDGQPEIAYVVVEAGHWLAYDPGAGFLYESTDGAWAQWYDPVIEEVPHDGE